MLKGVNQNFLISKILAMWGCGSASKSARAAKFLLDHLEISSGVVANVCYCFDVMWIWNYDEGDWKSITKFEWPWMEVKAENVRLRQPSSTWPNLGNFRCIGIFDIYIEYPRFIFFGAAR